MRNAMFKMLESYESTLKVMTDVPHYKRVAHPVYKWWFGGDRYPLFSVPATFFVMDALFHQVPLNLIRMLLKGETPYFSITFSMLWVSLSIPIALHKHWKNNAGVESERYERLVAHP
ncbi:MAG: hypothetical protein A3F12_07645 [Gammaproteobacteria bacterium RIFCSPHIGHO2_12_FULL_38_14]|nr:MAG: hypothetical protein A3F12_07645 [Gammaproteobacteria bacterium RIFCSPHIGHO2_12_FULL_38_14]